VVAACYLGDRNNFLIESVAFVMAHPPTHCGRNLLCY